MILTDRDNTMDYYDCGFTNAMSSNLASIRTTNDFSTTNCAVVSSQPSNFELNNEIKNKLEEIDFLYYKIGELEKTVERMKEIFELMNMKIN